MKMQFKISLILLFLCNSIYATSPELCLKDDDCVKVTKDCCPCSSMGQNKAILKSQKQAYEKQKISKCADMACLEAISTHWTCVNSKPVCTAGKCELKKL